MSSLKIFGDHRHSFGKVKGYDEGVYDYDLKRMVRDPYQERNMDLCKRIWSVLTFHYPGHPWEVGCSIKQGIAQIFLPTFSDWSFNIRLAHLNGDPGMKVVVKGAGELLERYRMPRSGFDISHYLAAKAKFKPHLTRTRRPPD